MIKMLNTDHKILKIGSKRVLLCRLIHLNSYPFPEILFRGRLFTDTSRASKLFQLGAQNEIISLSGKRRSTYTVSV